MLFRNRLASTALALGFLSILTAPPDSAASPGEFLFSLSNPTPQAGDEFGASDRAMIGNGEVIYIGDRSDDTGGENAGAVYVFDAHTGAYLRTILDPAGRPGDAFGAALAITPDGTLVVGAPFDDTQTTDCGTVYMFAPGASTPTRVLPNPDPDAGSLFGEILDAAGNRMVVSGSHAAAIYTFDPGSGALLFKFRGTSPRIALSEGQIAIAQDLYDARDGRYIGPSAAYNPGYGTPKALARCGENFIASSYNQITRHVFRYDVVIFHGATGRALKSYQVQRYLGNELTWYSSYGLSLTSLSGNPAFAYSNDSYVNDPPISTSVAVKDEWGADQFVVNGTDSEPILIASAGTRLLVSNPSTTDTVQVFDGPPPAEAPLPPTSISARSVPSTFSSSGYGALVSWSDPQAGVAAVEIQRRDGTGEFVAVGSTDAATTSYLDSTLPRQTEPYVTGDLISLYRVRAVNLAVGSSPSPEVAVIQPAVPSDLLASAAGSMISLTWTDHSAYEDGFTIERRTWDSSDFAVIGQVPANTTSFIDSTALPGGYYAYRVKSTRNIASSLYSNMAEASLTAPPPHLLKSLSNPEPVAGVGFGSSVASGNGMLVVGAPWADGPGGVQDAGRVYVFDAQTGTLRIALNSPAPHAGDRFGWSVAVSRNNILVGAPYADDGAADTGAAYLFSGRTGHHLTTLRAPAPAAGELFGWSLTPAGDNLAIGAPGTKAGAFAGVGAVYVTDPRNTQLRTLTNPTPAPNDNFGWAVAAWGDRIAAVAAGDDTLLSDGGSAYSFDWRANSLLSHNDLGYSVAPAGQGLFVVGVLNGTGTTRPRTGFAYLLNAETGGTGRTFASPVSSDQDQFGFAVASNKRLSAIGAPQADIYYGDSGWVWAYDEVTGAVDRRFDNPTPGTGDRFGHSICALENGDFAIGAPGDDTGAVDAGAVYYFSGQP